MDPLGHAAHFRYAESVPYSSSAVNRGRAVSTMDALGDEADATFNIDGSPVTTVYPATGQSGSGRGSTNDVYLYDESGDTSGQEQYGPLASAQTYDEGDTGGPFHTVSYAYGKEGETLGGSGSTEPVTYQYDVLYRLTALTDGGGHTTRYFYGAAGYLYQTAYPLSGATTAPLGAGSADTVTYTSYDGAGDVTTRVDGNGTTTTYTYADPESLLTNVHYTLPSSPPSYISALADTGYTYDAYGRRQAMGDATGSHSYSYDDGDMTLSDTTTYAGLPTETISYGYDPDGSRASMTTPGGNFSYSYDNAGRETGLTNPYGEASSWAYYANDWLQTQALADGATTQLTYDARGQVILQGGYTHTVKLAEYAMNVAGSYDGAGDRLKLDDGDGPYQGTTSYQYDGRNELTQEQSMRGGGYTDAQTYDGVTGGTTTGPGNLTTLRGTSQGFNADNQLTGTGYAYDGDGSPVTCRGASLAFDPEGRMTAYGGAQTDGYTGDGLRAWKQSSGGRTYYLYDGEQPVCELGASGGVAAANTFGAEGLLSRHTAAGEVFYVFDPSGNVSERLTSSGTVASSDLTDGFGARTTTDTSRDPFGFGGQWGGYTDAETGLTLFTHRFYDPATGRFLTRDPMGYEGGLNLYGYCANDPINRSDAAGYGWVDSLCARYPWLCFWRRPPTPTPQPTPTPPNPNRGPIWGQPVDPPLPVNEGPARNVPLPPKRPVRPIGGPGSPSDPSPGEPGRGGPSFPGNPGDPGSGGRQYPSPPPVEPPYELPPDEPPMGGLGPGEILGPVGIVGIIIDCVVHPEDCGAQRVPIC